ncbi:MAG: EVE domain-containing protein [Planctomycetaceae bacterium]|nr:EVE domain-containing protein [Planctomycetaceae bacterium]
MAKKSAKKPGRYWLLKSEADCYSIEKLEGEQGQTTFWDGVRNYQARNFIRDDMQVGDRAFFYHSNAKPMTIAGTVEITKSGYPDPTAFDKTEQHYDPKSDPDNPTWYVVDVTLLQKFPEPVTREQLKERAELSDMMLLQRGSRLSVQPVTEKEWKFIHRLAGVKDV